jgi:serine/threonine protein phosphatase PrpC
MLFGKISSLTGRLFALGSTILGGCATLLGCISHTVRHILTIPVATIVRSLRGRVTPLTPAVPWRQQALTVQEAICSMTKNATKAIEDHATSASVYITPLELPTPIALASGTPPLTLTVTVAEAQGPRPQMEDAHFLLQTPQGTLVGVCDGHGGFEVARYVSTAFQARFFEGLTHNQGNVHQTFERLVHDIHQEVTQHSEWAQMGTTLVVCYVDPHTHRVYTATLGDSEANIYRRMGFIQRSIPLSPMRNWAHPTEARRAANVLRRPEIAMTWPLEQNPKYLRYPLPMAGVNVSRAIGDQWISPPGGLVHKPKITVQQLRSGDRLVLASDGLKDHVPEPTIAVLSVQPSLAQSLVTCAINQGNSRDNVTVLVVEVQ